MLSKSLSVLQKHNVALRMCYEELQIDITKCDKNNMEYTKSILKNASEGLSVTIKRLENGEEVIRQIALEAKQ